MCPKVKFAPRREYALVYASSPETTLYESNTASQFFNDDDMENKDLKIFLVDDNELFAYMLAESLTHQYGFEIRVFHRGEDMLPHMEERPDIILLDYQLNSLYLDSLNGGQILKLVKKFPFHTYVVMVSSHEDLENSLRLLELGASDYIFKNTECVEQTAKTLLQLKELIYLKKKARKSPSSLL